eukprot:TRINITY_DN43188_c0_g1_i1.p1 TRINITY_DN43188_c0_g1~~TRINITY_DN43188_c0_g1_i1.p1  ORF type:complete len:443 (+),score=68.78 TRINITY_DN43188_c0_g1_i1:59-1330(+)
MHASRGAGARLVVSPTKGSSSSATSSPSCAREVSASDGIDGGVSTSNPSELRAELAELDSELSLATASLQRQRVIFGEQVAEHDTARSSRAEEIKEAWNEFESARRDMDVLHLELPEERQRAQALQAECHELTKRVGELNVELACGFSDLDDLFTPSFVGSDSRWTSTLSDGPTFGKRRQIVTDVRSHDQNFINPKSSCGGPASNAQCEFEKVQESPSVRRELFRTDLPLMGDADSAVCDDCEAAGAGGVDRRADDASVKVWLRQALLHMFDEASAAAEVTSLRATQQIDDLNHRATVAFTSSSSFIRAYATHSLRGRRDSRDDCGAFSPVAPQRLPTTIEQQFSAEAVGLLTALEEADSIARHQLANANEAGCTSSSFSRDYSDNDGTAAAVAVAALRRSVVGELRAGLEAALTTRLPCSFS